MCSIVGLQIVPSDIPIQDKDNRYHIEITDVDKNRMYCTGYTLTEVQTHVFQLYQFSIDLSISGEPISEKNLSENFKLRSIINAICAIMYNNSIDS